MLLPLSDLDMLSSPFTWTWQAKGQIPSIRFARAKKFSDAGHLYELSHNAGVSVVAGLFLAVGSVSVCLSV